MSWTYIHTWDPRSVVASAGFESRAFRFSRPDSLGSPWWAVRLAEDGAASGQGTPGMPVSRDETALWAGEPQRFAPLLSTSKTCAWRPGDRAGKTGPGQLHSEPGRPTAGGVDGRAELELLHH
jgi:hypothetical protein